MDVFQGLLHGRVAYQPLAPGPCAIPDADRPRVATRSLNQKL